MESKDRVFEQIQQYISNCKQGETDSEQLLNFIREHNDEEIIDRTNFIGHITSSAFIINEDFTALLLLKHKFLNRWLQPGGHVDSTDTSLLDSALREACEETGIDRSDLIPLSNNVFDINSHHIPFNPKKQEPAHVHHDVRFLFQCTNSATINISLDESLDDKWVSFVELASNADFWWAQEKIKRFVL